MLAVSGGVDSVALLHFLQNQPGLHLVVAHFDHGIRPDSKSDRVFVQELAKHYGLPFVYDTATLGPHASEAVARKKRYAFLQHVQQASHAQALITAHHQDDVIETAILNIMRGTGPRGLHALASTDDVQRPLLHVSKADIIAYAQSHGLSWREDSTNANDAYTRNYVRQHIVPHFSKAQRDALLARIVQAKAADATIDALLQTDFALTGNSVLRRTFVMLPHVVAREVLAVWLRNNELAGFTKSTIERLVVAAKTARAGAQFPIQKGALLQVDAQDLRIIRPHR